MAGLRLVDLRLGEEALKAFYTTGAQDSKVVLPPRRDCRHTDIRPPARRPTARRGIFHWDFTLTYISLFPIRLRRTFMKTICFPSLLPLTPKLWSKYSDTRCSRCLSASGGLLKKDKITQDMIALLDKWPPARKAYGSESATQASTFSAARGSGPVMMRPWPPARRAYASERKPCPLYCTRRKRLRCASVLPFPRRG